MPPIGLEHYLVVAGILFLLGLIAVMTRRNIVWLLMGVELILNSASLNFVAFSQHIAPETQYEHAGLVASVVIILLAAAEAAVALAILVAIYRNFRTIQSDDLHELRN
jgi:NADH-quinone oxidoreductase subunit K